MSPSGWTLTAVVAFSVGCLIIPLIAARASHRRRLDPALERMGRPFGWVADWVERNPRTIPVIVALIGTLYGAAAWLALQEGRHFLGVLAIADGIGSCLSMLSMHMMLRASIQARGGSPRGGPGHRREGKR